MCYNNSDKNGRGWSLSLTKTMIAIFGLACFLSYPKSPADVNPKEKKVRVKKFVKMKVKGSDGRWKNTDYSVREDGVLLNTYGNENAPIFVGQDFVDAGLPMPKIDCDWDAYSTEEQNLALTIDHPRVELTSESREIIEKWLSGEEYREKDRMARLNDRNNQNAFLKSKGYRWEKKRLYIGGEIGEVVEDWILRDLNGKAVIDFKDGGGWVKAIGDLKRILTQLGYYGQAAIDQLTAEDAARLARHEARVRVDAYFQARSHNPPETVPATVAKQSFTIAKSSRTRYAVADGEIWVRIYNGMDGDDWSLNNDGMFISAPYPYNAEIVADLELLRQ